MSMNSASKVGEIFLAAGKAYSQLGESVMTLYNCNQNVGTASVGDASQNAVIKTTPTVTVQTGRQTIVQHSSVQRAGRQSHL
uniref:Uncharacterized protein n=1 Tax=Pseudodiaptomus poplesia TaxID=213370 RepID=A0A1S6GL99_9MAXI|nr:hypothetical protein [Pseudodiaptomus poplesia]